MLVEIRNKMQRNTIQEDRKMLQEQKTRIEREVQQERDNLHKKKTLAKELLDMSLKNKERRKEQNRLEIQKENDHFKAKLRNLERTEKDLEKLKKEEKLRTGKQIQDYYERHVQMKKEREKRERLRDKEYLQMEIAKLEKEEKDRVDFFKKIKSGYKQNHSVQKKYQDFYKVLFLNFRNNNKNKENWMIKLLIDHFKRKSFEIDKKKNNKKF